MTWPRLFDTDRLVSLFATVSGDAHVQFYIGIFSISYFDTFTKGLLNGCDEQSFSLYVKIKSIKAVI